MNWNPSPTFIVQGGHAATGALAVFVPFALFGFTGAVLGSFVFIAYAVAKETWFDVKYEDANPFWPDGAKDLGFLIGGHLLSWGLLVLRFGKAVMHGVTP